MKIVYLVCGDRRSPEERQSYVSEGTLLYGSGGPILSLHHTVVRCGAAKRDPTSLIVGAHVVVLKDTGHWVLEEIPKETTDALMKFL